MTINAGDLARVKVSEPSEEWPSVIEIVAYWTKGHGRRGRRRAIAIDADQFFGRGRFGAPMSGEQLLGIVDRLRREGSQQAELRPHTKIIGDEEEHYGRNKPHP